MRNLLKLRDIKAVPITAYERVEIDARQRKAWDQTRVAFLWNCPSFTSVMYQMMNPNGDGDVAYFTRGIKTLATDDINLFVNPDYFFALTLQQRIFALGHEILHAIFNHCGLLHIHTSRGKIAYLDGVALPLENQIFQYAMDYVNNAVLVESAIGEMKGPDANGEGGWLYDRNIATSMDSVIDIYRKLYKEEKGDGKPPPDQINVAPSTSGGNGKPQDGPGKGQGKPKNGNRPGGLLDDHLKPGTGTGTDPAQAQREREANQAKWKQAVASAANAAKAMGKLPMALERVFKELTEPQIFWGDKVQAFVARRIGTGRYDYNKPDRRQIVRDVYYPSRSGYGCETIVVAMDTSGSMGQPEIDVMLGETKGILSDLRPRKVIVLWCDSRIHKVDEVEDVQDLETLKPVGGGGTNFRPVFDWIHNNYVEPDALIFFTDLWGPFPDKAPKYPVLWGYTDKNKIPPWGEKVFVPVKQAA